MTDVDDQEESQRYSEALTELEEILDELEDEALDVDILAAKVERASTLIRFCRSRIAGARTQVAQIVADLDQLAGAANGDSVPDEEAADEEAADE